MMDFYGIKFNKSEVMAGLLVQGIDEQSGLAIRWPQERPKSYIMR